MRQDLMASLDPRSKLAAFLACQALLFLPAFHFTHSRLIAIATPLLALLPFAGRSLRLWLRLLALSAPLLVFIVLAAVIQSLAGGPAWPGIIQPILGKTILVALSLALFVANEAPWRMLQALRQLGLPESAVVVLAIGYRFAGQWGIELEGLRRSWTSRNLAAMSKLRRVQCLRGVLPQFFERILESGGHLHDAMVSRGFNGSMPGWNRLVFARRDMFFLAFAALATMAIALA